MSETDPNVLFGRLSAITGPSSGSSFDAYLQANERGGTASNGKPSLTIDEAAAQLTRTASSWNNNWGEAATVTYAFRSTAPGTMPEDTSGFSRFNAAQIAATERALLAWSDAANITFTRVGSGTSSSTAYSNSATILFGNYSSGMDGAAAFAYFPYSFANSSSDGDVWVNNSLDYNANPEMFGYGQLALIHEIGHAIGLSHPGDYDADPDIDITYDGYAEYYEDSMQYTVMSYFFESYTGGNFGPSYPATIMLDDIAAAQRLYGANMSTRTGDTVYGFNSNAGREWFQATSSSSPLIFAVWDAGGTDTFNFSGYASSQKIDLRQGNFSDVGGLIGNVAVAKGAAIENAIGGSGADTIIGNGSANRLQGNAGSDTLTGAGGADVFVFTKGGGADIVTDFTVGSDKLDGTAFGAYISIAQSGSDTLITFASTDTVRLTGVSASTITSNSFIGVSVPPAGPVTVNGTSGADTLVGGSGNDFLYGFAGGDKLDGKGGADEMHGGAGADYYYVDNAGDKVIELAGEGNDTVLSTVTIGLSAAVENLTLTGTAAINGSGSSTANVIAGNDAGNQLSGYSGADQLFGKGGSDTLIGGAAADQLTGGAGRDVFLYSAMSDSTVAAPDRILDFDAASDTIDLRRLDANTALSGDQAFAWQSAFTGHAGEAVLAYDAGANVTTLTLDANGDGVADFKLLINGHVLGDSGFIL